MRWRAAARLTRSLRCARPWRVAASQPRRCADARAMSPPRWRATVGDPPLVPSTEIDIEPGSWTAARGTLDEYLARLATVDAALREAGERLGAGLARRADLRGLLGAYRDKAQRTGHAEDVELAA